MATQNVSEEQLQSQFTYIDAVARLLGDKRPKAYTHTFGCQQNEADTERIRGMLSRKWATKSTDTPDEGADFILSSTPAPCVSTPRIARLRQRRRARPSDQGSARSIRLLQCAAA